MKTRTLLLAALATCIFACQTAYERAQTFYAEETHDGRLYLIGREATHKTFKSTHELAKSNTFIGAGVNGQTVIVEGDDKDPTLEARLISEYRRRTGIGLR